ncbi:bifunctional diguanylate cyclase/phosphodiesterase [Acidaminobacter sp. JC074]|uniref:putative bifunctional diguanylate cyclase/phosphodiesterase n=1 Tax=Acidaminobacter sp. JC074 TaxID=2530199 RepID=UPI001F0E6AB9|nr:bifunctional diguanylate cyclase/phosphodiesterase [Acidaminobacter sp. JC074]MCH4888538.1 bifunctional diguanylate cyclase/phosphodiesterase [Acidaminobacter sp. JC074]
MRHVKDYKRLGEIPGLTELKKELTKLVKKENKFALFYINIDDFAQINESLGYDVGDKVLIEIVNRIRKNMRLHDFLSRQKGDEFTLLITELDTFDYLGQIVERFMALFKSPVQVNGHVIEVSISIGVSLYPDHSDNPDDLLQYANIAMYFSKSTGKRTCTTFNQHMDSSLNVKQDLIKEIRNAINEKQFRIYYQPHVNSDTGGIIGAEALLRWHHPNKVMVLPNDYLQVAEETGLIVEIENWIISEVFQQIHLWKTMMNWDIPISINLSISHLRRIDFIAKLEKMMELYDIRPILVVFEIPENALYSLNKQIHVSISKLVELGFSICIDNFSVAPSALKYIKENTVNQIKINRNIINGIFSNHKDEAIINSMMTLSNELGISLIAKGVEHEDQINYLAEIGCHVIQGYYYSKPLDIGDFENYVKK